MINVLKYKWVFFAISLLVILPGIASLALFGLRLSIDFTGGTLLEIQNVAIKESSDIDRIKAVMKESDVTVASVVFAGNNTYVFRISEMNTEKKNIVFTKINALYPSTKELRFENVGPVIGKELTIKAIQSVAVASVAIILYIAYAFRQIPKPYSAWKFGIVALVALVHDVIVVIGLFSLLGHFFGVEIDALFVTALLTVIGFSVHDTIVVFDRIRENLQKSVGKISFSNVVNESIVQTLDRSLMTSLTVLFTLLALILFGGESIRYFVVALFVGVFSGTYSSIFNAAPLLAIWEERSVRKNHSEI